MTYPETLPDTAAASDPGHVTDHNLLTTAVGNIDSRLHTVETTSTAGQGARIDNLENFVVNGGYALPPVDIAGVTITKSSNSTSTLTNATLVAANNPVFRFNNAVMSNVGTLGSFSNCQQQLASTYTLTSQHMGQALNVSFMSDAEELDIIVHVTARPYAYQYFRVMIDGVYVMATEQAIGNTTGFYRIKVSIASGVKSRLWRLEATGVAFCGVYRAAARSIWGQSNLIGPRVVNVCDSYGMQASASGGNAWLFGNYMYQASFITGWDVHINSIGGTGFQNDNYGNGDLTYLSRLNSQVIAVSPDIVAVQVSVNDPYYGGYNLSTVNANMNSWFSQLYAALPDVSVLGISGIVCNSNVYSQLSSISSNMETLCGTYPNAEYINALGWLYGAGRSDAPTTLGNTDIYIGPDGVHLTLAGYTYLAERIASSITSLYGKRSLR